MKVSERNNATALVPTAPSFSSREIPVENVPRRGGYSTRSMNSRIRNYIHFMIVNAVDASQNVAVRAPESVKYDVPKVNSEFEGQTTVLTEYPSQILPLTSTSQPASLDSVGISATGHVENNSASLQGGTKGPISKNRVAKGKVWNLRRSSKGSL